MPPTDAELRDRVDAVLAARPDIPSHRCAEALHALATARDAETDASRRGGLNVLISLVMGVKHPLGEPPWDALAAARDAAFSPSGEPANA